MRRVLVTGAAGGIGEAIAQALHQVGMEVIGVDLKAAAKPEGFRLIQADISSSSDLAEVQEEIGAIDILVNNAGTLLDEPFLGADLGAARALFDVNLFAALELSQRFIPGMTEQGWGRIVNIGSVAARTGGTVSNSLFYAASKAALMSATRSLAREFGAAGITVNSIVPGAIATAMAHEGRSEATRTHMLQALAIKRFGETTDVSGLVTFLCSEEASFITGAALDVNGGWHMA